MARIAYRLWIIKDEENYIKAGYSLEETKNIIDLGYDIDEDFTNKKDYIKQAKNECNYITRKLKLSKPLNWKITFGTPDDIGYRYCSKCNTFFWDGDPCECED